MAEVLERLDAVLHGRYALDREIGRGGTATVYLAADRKHRRTVAIKVLRPEIALAVGPERFLLEIDTVARLQHPHILPLYDSGAIEMPVVTPSGETRGAVLPYFVMPYVRGESLRDRLVRELQLPLDDALAIAHDVMTALAFAHAHGILHRDIKPENILLEEGEAVVADFGVARAISAAATPGNSEAGLAIGTPAYMSPEQTAGGLLDARSDIYSLGCVIYEMLVGEAPFTGATAQIVFGRHQCEPPRPLRTVRPQVPAVVEAVVLTALAKTPADRFRTVADFARALPRTAAEAAATPLPGPIAGASAHERRPLHRRIIDALRARIGWVLALATLGGAAAYPLWRPAARVPLDPALYLVAPFHHRAAAAPALLSGDECESLAYDALARWSGLRVVDPLWVSDARARRGNASMGIADAVAIARDRGAGRLLAGEVYSYRDTVRVRAAVYDVRHPTTPLRSVQAAVAPDLHDAAARFDDLVRRLVAGTTSLGASVAPAGAGTSSFAAWRAYDEGTRALRSWDLPRARRSLVAAAAGDDAYPQPRLSLAQLLLVEGKDAVEWQGYAREAARLESRLLPADRTRARALVALADGRYPEACTRYESLLRADSLDFFAWYGLGECHAGDHLVVRDRRSPSGWRFRSSLQRGLAAYERALAVLPSSHLLFRDAALDRLTRLFLVDPTVYRRGYRLESDTVRFAAWPGLGPGDTLALVPWPAADLFDRKAGTRSASFDRALARNRDRLREVTTGWVRAFPRSAPAWEAHARALEVAGRLDGATAEESALLAASTAQRLAVGTVLRARLAATRVRLLVKLEHFAVARWLADSTLAATSVSGDSVAEQLVGLAALTGRQRRALELIRPLGAHYEAWSDDAAVVVRPPPPVGTAALELLVWASFTTPAESVHAAYARADRLVTSWYSPAERGRAREAVLSRAEGVGFFEAGLVARARPVAAAHRLRQAEWDLAHGDTTAVRRTLAEVEHVDLGRAGDIGMPGLYMLSRLHLALGDTAGAIDQLDPALEALPTLDAYLLLEVPDPAALVRAMALRAELAAARGDRATARKWGGAVAELWSGADPALRPVVARMRELSSRP